MCLLPNRRLHGMSPQPSHPEMSARTMAHYLRRIRHTNQIPALADLAHEIRQRFPADRATPTLTAFIATKVERLTKAN